MAHKRLSPRSLEGPGTSSLFKNPLGLSLNSAGQVVVSDAMAYRVRVLAPPPSFEVAAAAPVCDGSRWHSVAASFTNATGLLTLYVDGAAAASRLFSMNTADGAATALVIGGTPLSAEGFSGSLAEVRVYGRALSAADALALAQPPLPVFANAVMTPAAVTSGATAYSFYCGAGFNGTALVLARSLADFSWSATGGALSPGASAPLASAAMTCSICPTGSWSAAGSDVCSFCAGGPAAGAAAGANSSAACASPSPTPSASASPSPTISLTSSPTPSITPSSSLSPSVTSSVTPTQSQSSTPSLSPTPTPSTTASWSATASVTASQTATPSNTQTPTNTPSPSTVPDVLLYFGVDIVPTATSLTAANVAVLPAFLSSSAAAFAAALGVSPSSLYAVNVTDRATGLSIAVGSIRRLGGAGGSTGVTITYVVRLGKTPLESAVANMTNILVSPSLLAGALSRSVSLLAAATGMPAGSFAASVPPGRVLVANAAFLLGNGAGSSPSSSSSGGGVGSGALAGGIVGGVAGAIALACAIWARRSYAKHNKLPCFRDRRSELFARKSLEFEAKEVDNALAEAERAIEAREEAARVEAAAAAAAATASKFGGGAAPASASGGTVPAKPKGPKKSKRDVIQLLVESEAAQARELAAARRQQEDKDREVAALRAQLRAAKDGGGEADELAELRRQLAEAKAVAAAAVAAAAAAGGGERQQWPASNVAR